MQTVGAVGVDVKVNFGDFEKQMAELKRKLENVNDTVVKIDNVTNAIKRLAVAAAAAFSINKLINYTAVWTDLNSRVNIAAGSIENGAAVMERLGEMADRTYTSLEQTAETYLLNATTLRELGYSTEEALDFTEALNNALVVSGAKGDRAASVMNALSKAMALGKLSGDNLNTVIQSGGRVSEALANGLGVTVNELRRLGKEGKLTGTAIQQALTKEFETLREEAENMPATISDAFLRINNALLKYIGTTDAALGISSSLANVMITLSENIGRVVIYVGALATAWGVAYVAAMVKAAVATGGLTVALKALRTALIRTGIGAIVVLVGELIYQFLELYKRTGSMGAAFKELWSISSQIFGRMGDLVKAFEFVMSSAALRIKADFLDAFASIADAAAFLTGSDGISSYANSLRQSAGQSRAVADSDTRQAQNFWGIATRPLEYAPGQGNDADLSDHGPRNTPSDPDADKKAAKLKKAYEDITRGAREFIAAQQLEAQVLGLTEEAANALRYQQDLLNQAQQDGIELTPKQTEELKALAAQMAGAEAETKALTEAFDFSKDVFKGFFTDIRSQLAQGATLWEAFGTAVNNVINKIIDKLLDSSLDMLFSSLFGGGGGMGGTSGGVLGFLSSLFGGHATGTEYSGGGYRMVGERGPELMRVPGGSKVVPNNQLTGLGTPGMGGGTVVQIVDQRSGNSPDVEQERSTGPNGEQMLRFIIREEQAKNIASGRMDAPQRARFGNRPRTN